MPSNLQHNPWDMTSDGPSLVKAKPAPAVSTEVKYFHNYKVLKYSIEGVNGSIILAKANRNLASQPGGADDMFRDLQSTEFGLERRILRKATTTDDTKYSDLQGGDSAERVDDGDDADDDDDDDEEDDFKGEDGIRMVAFAMNFGFPYKFAASGGSRPFEGAPTAVRSARALLNWAQRAFVNEKAGDQDFNEELVFAYLESQKIKYHDDGEKGLGPRIATLSLGASATMSVRVKKKYFANVSKTGVVTYKKPLPLPVLESSEWVSGYTTKKKDRKKQHEATKSRDTYENRLAAWAELQALKAGGDSKAFAVRSKQLAKELQLTNRRSAKPILSFRLTHGDIVIMKGEEIQKYLEHEVVPHGNLRYALTCRTVLSNHLKAEELPSYEVQEDTVAYNGKGIREERDGDAINWE